MHGSALPGQKPSPSPLQCSCPVPGDLGDSCVLSSPAPGRLAACSVALCSLSFTNAQFPLPAGPAALHTRVSVCSPVQTTASSKGCLASFLEGGRSLVTSMRRAALGDRLWSPRAPCLGFHWQPSRNRCCARASALLERCLEARCRRRLWGARSFLAGAQQNRNVCAGEGGGPLRGCLQSVCCREA